MRLEVKGVRSSGQNSLVGRKSEPPPVGVQNWRDLYRAALFEMDSQKLPLRIAEAERALNVRACELYAMSSETSEEGQSIQHALSSLRALSYCLRLKTEWPQAG